MLIADHEFEMVGEIDKWRFVAFIMLELLNKKPIPLDEDYLARKGFDFKKHKLSRTLDSLKDFIELSDVKETTPPMEEIEKTTKPATLSDEEFIASLKTNKAYSHVNIDIELGKMDSWLLLNPNRKKTRRFILNWINKVEKPLDKERKVRYD